MKQHTHVVERIISGRGADSAWMKQSSVVVSPFVSEACGATNFSTGIANFAPDALLPYHTHTYGEAVTILEGRARMLVEGRSYTLGQGDCMYIPPGVSHAARNDEPGSALTVHWAGSAAQTAREITVQKFQEEPRGEAEPQPADPEKIMRFHSEPAYELSPGAFFRDLFAKRYGAANICGGYARFKPGASLPCHIHDFDESITIIQGRATCWVEGRAYELGDNDTAYVPRHVPHRFLNKSGSEMAMIWVYAGDEPDRQIVEPALCSPPEIEAEN